MRQKIFCLAFLTILALVLTMPASVQAADYCAPVKFINQSNADSWPNNFFDANGTIYFCADAGVRGYQIWKTDGSDQGTTVVWTPQGASNSSIFNQQIIYDFDFTQFNGHICFKASDILHGSELFKSDGTANGTTIVCDIRPGEEGSSPTEFKSVGSLLYFSAHNGYYEEGNCRELWKSDGTTSGTAMVKDIRPGSDSSEPYSLTNVNGVLYFTANDATHGRELWRSDGTASGTVMVRNIDSRNTDSGGAQTLIAFHDHLLLTAYDNEYGQELWISDGTASGTTRLSDIGTGLHASFPWPFDNYYAVVGDTLFFSAQKSLEDCELWKSDGTSSGTMMVKDIIPGNKGSNPIYLTAASDKLYFFIQPKDQPLQFWTSDGTPEGTRQVASIEPYKYNFLPFNKEDIPLVVMNDIAYLRIRNSEGGCEMWRSDGTTSGTYPLQLNVPVENIMPISMTPTSRGLFFNLLADGTHGSEPWISNGAAAGTHILKDLNAKPNIFRGASPHAFADVGGRLFFSASDSRHGHELWASDGTEQGTYLVSNINKGSSSEIASIVDVDGIAYFHADGGAGRRGIWKSDGTSQGTELVKALPDVWNIGSMTIESDRMIPDQLTPVGQRLFFRFTHQLWVSDGTDQGTMQLNMKNIPGITMPTSIGPMAARGDQLIFAGDGKGLGMELWSSAGTIQETSLIRDIQPGSESSNPDNFICAGNALFFSATDAMYGRELWLSDGTASGTALIRNINPHGNSDPQHFALMNNHLFFSADDGEHGRELWISDGSQEGTAMLCDIRQGSDSSSPQYLTTSGNRFYFTAFDGVHGRELWTSNGTHGNACLLKDISPFPLDIDYENAGPSELTAAGNCLYFKAEIPVTDNQITYYETALWRTDGSTEETVPVHSGFIFFGNYHDQRMLGIGRRLFFSAKTPELGDELWQAIAPGNAVMPQVWEKLR